MKYVLVIFTVSGWLFVAHAQNIHYTYDNAGRLTEILYPNQMKVIIVSE